MDLLAEIEVSGGRRAFYANHEPSWPTEDDPAMRLLKLCRRMKDDTRDLGAMHVLPTIFRHFGFSDARAGAANERIDMTMGYGAFLNEFANTQFD
uniref:O-methyltransferase n=1 Tax=Ascaris lumbricoides TaxID=6252 RepID=A0A0M3IR30_ASCLU